MKRALIMTNAAIAALCAACVHIDPPKPPRMLVTKNVRASIKAEVCALYAVRKPLATNETIAYMTSVVWTKEGQVAVGAPTVFVTATGSLTVASTSQMTVTYTEPSLTKLCDPPTIQQVGPDGHPIPEALRESEKPDYEELNPDTMTLRPVQP